jgi:Na+/H+ antiporter NhaD/arsenite permease-like protein
MDITISILFIIGYSAIALESLIKTNKAATALLTGIMCWTVYVILGNHNPLVSKQLTEHLSSISSIIFFLLGAMTIVEMVDSHNGFKVITDRIKTRNKRALLWLVGFVTFFLSSVLDNMTTTIVMVTLLRKLIENRSERYLFAGIVVIAANAGGSWSPIGDVTTTMLWIGGQVTTLNIMLKLIVPSLACLIIPLVIASIGLKGNFTPLGEIESKGSSTTAFEGILLFCMGLGALIFVPIFKFITGLPPYMGILFGLAVLWLVTEFLHMEKNEEDKSGLTVSSALHKIDAASILFFLGILLAVACLESTGILEKLAHRLTFFIVSDKIIVVILGLFSAVIDNVPLVAASMGMYSLQTYPTDHYFWEFLAYCAGTGGSCLIIGSAAGVVAMGIEKINFIWYLKKISLLALIGYFTGVFIYLIEIRLFHF